MKIIQLKFLNLISILSILELKIKILIYLSILLFLLIYLYSTKNISQI